MKQQAVPAHRRGRPLPNEAFPEEFVRYAYMLAIRRAARDAHRSQCDRDAGDCESCRGHTETIAEAKRRLNHDVEVP